MPFTWSLMKSSESSTKACVRLGTPVLALRATSHMKPKARTHTTSVDSTVSTFTAQNPPDSFTGWVKNVRWWLMDSVGESTSEAAIGGGRSVAGEQGNTEQ